MFRWWVFLRFIAHGKLFQQTPPSERAFYIMARFTASEKWGDGWFSNLNPYEKLIFLYLTDKCDNAGFYEINNRIDPFVIGITQQEYEQGLVNIKKCYIKSTDGRKIWLKNYLKHQKNIPLNPENNAHKQIIIFIQSNMEYFEYDFNNLAPNKGLFRGLGNVLGNSKGNSSVIVPQKLNFNTRPSASDFNGLPPAYHQKGIEYVFNTKRVKIDADTIQSMWEIFKVQKLTGDEYYPNEGKVFSHFLDWLKKQDFTQTIHKSSKSEYELEIERKREAAKNLKPE